MLAPGKEATAVNFASVIDIAAHLQKEAPVGGLAVSQTTAAFLGGLNAIGTEQVMVKNTSAAIWQPHKIQFQPGQTGKPALPST